MFLFSLSVVKVRLIIILPNFYREYVTLQKNRFYEWVNVKCEKSLQLSSKHVEFVLDIFDILLYVHHHQVSQFLS